MAEKKGFIAGAWAAIVGHRLSRDTLIYTSAAALSSLASFLMLPLYSRFLTPEDYGVFATYTAGMSIAGIFVFMGAENSILVSFARKSREEFANYLYNLILLVLANSLAVFVLAALFGGMLAKLFNLTMLWLYVVFFMMAVNTGASFAVMVLMAREDVIGRSVFVFVQTMAGITATGAFVVAGMGWRGMIAGGLVSSLVMSGAGAVILWRQMKGAVLRFDPAAMKEALAFGLPLVPLAICGQIIGGLDRFIINGLVSVSETGLYSMGYRMAAPVSVLVSAFNSVWMPFFFRRMQEDTHQSRAGLARMTILYISGLMLVAVLWGFIAPWVLGFFLGKDFQGSSRFVIWISLAYAFQGVYMMATGYFYYFRRTGVLSVLGISLAVLNAGLTYALVARLGAIGAAFSVLATYIAFSGLAWMAASRLVRMPWPGGRQGGTGQGA